MVPKSVLILTPDPALADLLSIHLADDGYRVACRDSSLGIMQILQQAMPDLLIVSLADNRTRGNWRLVEQLHHDPMIETRVIAVVDRHRCDDDLCKSLDDITAAILPLVFDQEALLNTVRHVVGSSTDASPRRDMHSRGWRKRPRNGDTTSQPMSSQQLDRIQLGLGRSGLPSNTLERIQALSEQEREILGRNHFLTNEERQEILEGIKAEMERLWAQRRRELLMMDPDLLGLPASVLARSMHGESQVEP